MTVIERDSTDAGMPLVSVVMPCYREPTAVLQRAIESVLGQTLEHIELIVVVDDPERTDVVPMLQDLSAADARVRIVTNAVNLGVWPSYNRGVKAARGRYIAIQDADDASLPRRLEKLVDFLTSNPDVDVVGCGLEYIDVESGRSLTLRHYPALVDTEIRRRCPLAHATTVRKAELYERFGFYDESEAYRHAADYELWCRWYVQGVRMANIADCEYLYFQSGENFKARNAGRILKDTIRIKRKYAQQLAFSASDSLYLFAESVAARLPERVIMALFYLMTTVRSRSLRHSS